MNFSNEVLLTVIYHYFQS